MRNRITVSVVRSSLVLAILLIAVFGVTQSQESSATPPKDLKFVDDHWTAWDPPAANAGNYLIVKGDTLWDLAANWLDDPFLWPQIWDENRYILDSHWIYPGDPLVVPNQPEMIGDDRAGDDGDDMIAVVEDPAGDDGAGDDAPSMTARLQPRPLQPVADATDIYCSGYIDDNPVFSDLWIAGRDPERLGLAEGDVIYLNQGRNQGISGGDEFAVVRRIREVTHPSSGASLGSFIRRLGKVKVMVAQADTATAIIEMSCTDIQESDELLPWTEIAVPRFRNLPEFDQWDAEPSGAATGHIVRVADDRDSVGTGRIIHTDLGVGSGAEPGSVIRLYQERSELPRRIIGQAIVLTVDGGTSTAKITQAVRETHVGDRVEITR